ncbi:VOC family protein [Nodosilinea sp. LEGE 07298]|uniref:VOC family protein n=1 Tax=Nodosilinea sp. LEGE 07298 TaxID=2777970 RepID=UPI001881DCE4|nr:VOC family protein [Nodosilinea sp. LEGE 07298]MBE9113460.1 VOC family protein [Nodosilinea sp. LEGE 07298]
MAENDNLTTQSVGFTVADMARSLDFYTQILPFQKISDQQLSGKAFEQLTGLSDITLRVVQFQLGDEILELTEYSSEGKPIPADTRSNDRWFQHLAIVVSDMEKAHHQVQQHLVRNVSTQPQTLPQWNPDVAGIQAFYFQDPDGHFLELIQFPPDKGAAKWRQDSDDLFLGIDHTAIVVADTDTSLEFYQDTLGLALEQSIENYGQEHEHLSRVPGAHLKITRLNPSQGIGVELLEYLAPQDGRPMPDDVRPNDIVHWQTTLVAKDVLALTAQTLTEPVSFDSSGVVTVPPDITGFKQAALVRDPDGHALRLVAVA